MVNHIETRNLCKRLSQHCGNYFRVSYNCLEWRKWWMIFQCTNDDGSTDKYILELSISRHQKKISPNWFHFLQKERMTIQISEVVFMWFWWFILVCDLLVPFTMLIAGRMMWKHCPKHINGVIGYRTRRSWKYRDMEIRTWLLRPTLVEAWFMDDRTFRTGAYSILSQWWRHDRKCQSHSGDCSMHCFGSFYFTNRTCIKEEISWWRNTQIEYSAGRNSPGRNMNIIEHDEFTSSWHINILSDNLEVTESIVANQ